VCAARTPVESKSVGWGLLGMPALQLASDFLETIDFFHPYQLADVGYLGWIPKLCMSAFLGDHLK
jgi:hypothetical protein